MSINFTVSYLRNTSTKRAFMNYNMKTHITHIINVYFFNVEKNVKIA